MPSLYVAFLSHALPAQRQEEGWLRELQNRLESEVQLRITGQTFTVFYDRDETGWVEQWQKRIESSNDSATILIPVITPSYMKIDHCRNELERFLELEKSLGRHDLIYPIMYVDTPALAKPMVLGDPLAQEIAKRPKADWTDLRLNAWVDPKVTKQLQWLSAKISNVIMDMPETVEQTPETAAADTNELPTAWLLHYKDDDRPAPLFLSEDPGTGIEWRSTKTVKGITASDPVIYWKDVGKEDRGGLVGTGRFTGSGPSRHEDLPETKGTKEQRWYYFPTEFVEIFPRDVLPRDDVIEHTGLDLGWRFGSILKVPGEMAVKVDLYLRSKGKIGLFEVHDQQQEPEPETSHAEIGFIADAAEIDDDFLGRRDLAFVLAVRLNRIWNEANCPDRPGTRFMGRLRFIIRRIRSYFAYRIDPRAGDGSSFVVHIDAPWGGGKTTFANYLTYILNPYRQSGGLPDWLADLPLHDPVLWPDEFRRAWHVVNFNAWQHQHVDPPWWCFYQTIRDQCFHSMRKTRFVAKKPSKRKPKPNHSPPRPSKPNRLNSFLIRHLKWIRLWDLEISWRIFNPATKTLILTFMLTLIAAMLGLLKPEAYAKALTEGLKAESIYTLLSTTLVILFGGATAIWSVFSAFTKTLLPGTADAAKNYSMGSGDPLERLRHHFDRLVRSLKRPVVVVVDDIDRCKPDFVVALLQGIQTILKSPRVIFVLLGDRDWIENAYASVHKTMAAIEVGPEHTFGGRFVEKSIQLSLVLPEITPAVKTGYVRSTLGAPRESRHEVGTPPESRSRSEIELKAGLDKILLDSNPLARDANAAELRQKIDADQKLDSQTRKAFVKKIDRQMALRSASDGMVKKATEHRLMPIAEVLPANPRQIKRIINGIALCQEIGRISHGIQPGSKDWCNLALWVVIMTEWPRTWATISRYPGIVERCRSPECQTSGTLPELEVEKLWVKSIKADKALMDIINFKHEEDSVWQDAGLDADAVAMLRTIMPAAGGKLLDRDSPGSGENQTGKQAKSS
jgi:hypothetical protein